MALNSHRRRPRATTSAQRMLLPRPLASLLLPRPLARQPARSMTRRPRPGKLSFARLRLPTLKLLRQARRRPSRSSSRLPPLMVRAIRPSTLRAALSGSMRSARSSGFAQRCAIGAPTTTASLPVGRRSTAARTSRSLVQNRPLARSVTRRCRSWRIVALSLSRRWSCTRSGRGARMGQPSCTRWRAEDI